MSDDLEITTIGVANVIKNVNLETTPFEEPVHTVTIGSGSEEHKFLCDEEPHMLEAKYGYGYYPLALGQKLKDDKYEIVRKLGWGDNSSVWLASIVGSTPIEYVAIKVLTVDQSSGVFSYLSSEFDTIKLVSNKNPNNPGYKHCLYLREHFITTSTHGPHLCMVTDPLGSDIDTLRYDQFPPVFPIPIVKRITKQTLMALDYLHRECQMVHTDVKPENILVSIEDAGDKITACLLEDPSSIYEPRSFAQFSPDPIITVKTQPLPNFGLDTTLNNISIKLGDYGSCVPIGKRPFGDVAQPVLLRAPEVILDHPWSTPVDIWSVGCLIFEYMAGVAFFEIHKTSTASYTDVHLERMLELLGQFPPDFLNACKKRSEYFDEKGSLLRIETLYHKSIEECFAFYGVYLELKEEDIAAAATFMRRCLALDPSSRPSAAELLQDDWLKDA